MQDALRKFGGMAKRGQVHISGRGLFHSNGLFCCCPQLHSQRQIALIALVDCDGIYPTSS